MVSRKEKGMAGRREEQDWFSIALLFGFCIVFTCYLFKNQQFYSYCDLLQLGSFAEVTEVCCLDFQKMEKMLVTTMHDRASCTWNSPWHMKGLIKWSHWLLFLWLVWEYSVSRIVKIQKRTCEWNPGQPDLSEEAGSEAWASSRVYVLHEGDPPAGSLSSSAALGPGGFYTGRLVSSIVGLNPLGASIMPPSVV